MKILGEVRDRYRFKLASYVVMPEHIHLLISEPPNVTPSKVILEPFPDKLVCCLLG